MDQMLPFLLNVEFDFGDLQEAALIFLRLFLCVTFFVSKQQYDFGGCFLFELLHVQRFFMIIGLS